MVTKSSSGEPSFPLSQTAVTSDTTAELVDTTTAPPARGTAGAEVQQTPLNIGELNAPDGNAPVEINDVYKVTHTSRDHILTRYHRMMIASMVIPRLGLTLDRIQHH